MGLVGPLLPREVHGRIPRIVRRRFLPALLRLEALVARPGLHQRAVHGEVFPGEEPQRLRLLQNPLKEPGVDLSRQQPIPILREHRRVPDGVVHAQAHEPTEQEVVVELFHQLPLAPDRVEHLQQQRPEKLLGRNRRSADVGVESREAPRKFSQDCVHHLSNRTQRVIFRDPLLRGDVAEDVFLAEVVSAHRGLLRKVRRHPTPGIYRMNRKIKGFSATC